MLRWLTHEMKLYVKLTPRRKTASISVKDNIITVVAPDNMPHPEILNVVEKKRRWILEKIRFNGGAIGAVEHSRR